MSDIFEIYQKNIQELLSKISDNQTAFENALDLTQSEKTKKLNDIQYDLKQTEGFIKSIELQMSSFSGDPNLILTIKGYRKEYDILKHNYSKIKEKFELESKQKKICKLLTL